MSFVLAGRGKVTMAVLNFPLFRATGDSKPSTNPAGRATCSEDGFAS